MKFFWGVLAVLAVVAFLVFLASFICFYFAFYAKKRRPSKSEDFQPPSGKIYEPHYTTMKKWAEEVRNIKHTKISIRSFDGLVLHAKYYEYAEGAPIEIMFHGYRGSAERDLCGGVQRCFALGRNALIVDQRSHGKSEGNVITFGINESRDCHAWVQHIIKTFGPDIKIILAGISMGAATVLIAAGSELPKNVVGVLADCGFTSAKDIIKKTIREMHLPATLLYPFVKLSAKIFGNFDLEQTSPVHAMKSCKVPIIFIHGESDDFVPCYMSKINFEACQAPKKLLTVAQAGHGLSYLLNKEEYLNAIADFFTKNGLPTRVLEKTKSPLNF